MGIVCKIYQHKISRTAGRAVNVYRINRWNSSLCSHSKHTNVPPTTLTYVFNISFYNCCNRALQQYCEPYTTSVLRCNLFLVSFCGSSLINTTHIANSSCRHKLQMLATMQTHARVSLGLAKLLGGSLVPRPCPKNWERGLVTLANFLVCAE